MRNKLLLLLLSFILHNPRLCKSGNLYFHPNFNPKPVLTGALLIAGLESAGNSIVNNAGAQARSTATQVAGNLITVATQLRQILGEQITTPIDNLRQDLKVHVMRAQVALDQAQDFIQATSTCLVSEANSLLAALNSNLTHNVSNITFWREKYPVVYSIEKLGGQRRIGFYIEDSPTISVKGANFDIKEVTSFTILNVSDRSKKVTASLLSKSDQELVIKCDALHQVGLFEIHIRYKSRGFFTSRQKDVKGYFTVLPQPYFVINYSLTPVCNTLETKEFNTGRLDATNEGCDGDTHTEGLFQLPPGYTYAGHEYVSESAAGSEKEVDTHQGGGVVHVKWKLRQPECINYLLGKKRIGGRSWVHGWVKIIGTKPTETVAPPLQGSFPRITYQESKTIRLPENSTLR